MAEPKSSPLRSKPLRLVPATKEFPLKFVPVMLDAECNCASVIDCAGSGLRKSALLRLVPVKLALDKLARNKVALVRFSPLRSNPLRSLALRNIPVVFVADCNCAAEIALVGSGLLKLAKLRFAEEKSVSVRLVRAKLAVFKFAEFIEADVRSA